MWRLLGDWLYRLFLLSIFTIQTIAIIALSITLSMRIIRYPLPLPEHDYLFMGVVLVSLCLLLHMIYILIYHIVSDILAREHQRQTQLWLTRWGEVLLNGTPPPTTPLPKVAVTTLINLLQTFKGEDKDLLRLCAQSDPLKIRWRKQLNAHSVSTRLNALEALATVGLPEFLPTVLQKLDDKHFSVRAMALKVAACIIAQTPSDMQPQFVKSFSEAIRQSKLPRGVLTEALSLTEDAIAPVLVDLLNSDQLSLSLLIAIINVVGRLRLLEFSPYITRYVSHENPKVRAAAISTFAQLGYLPPELWETLECAAHDPLEKIRIQAVRTLALMPSDKSHAILWKSLADESWWVRQAASEALIYQGDEGVALLRQAVEHHPERSGVQMALESLLNHQLIEDLQAEEWIWAQA
jgi:HEAT repeat protein